MKIIIANSSPDPIYEQITKQLKAQILSGELAEGAALPSIRRLALDLQVSVITTKRAYDELEREGFINTVAGKGTYVAVHNQDLLREKRIKLVEEKLAQAVNEARLMGVSLDTLEEMLRLLYKEDL